MSRVDAKPLPSQEFLCECFDYNHETGELRWRVRPLSHFSTQHRCNNINARFAGKLAGNGHNRGYLLVRAAGVSYLAHRIIWKMVTGQEPPPHLDHRDNDCTNNRMGNLRPATKQQNGFNRPASATNKSGAKGVVWVEEKQRFAAYIKRDGKSRFLGHFLTVDLAAAAYRSAAEEFHGEFVNTEARSAS